MKFACRFARDLLKRHRGDWDCVFLALNTITSIASEDCLNLERFRMSVIVEFFGIPRVRAGVAETLAEGLTTGDVLQDLARRFPKLAETCIDGNNLKPGYTLNLRGDQFLTDPAVKLVDGDVLLILSLDAGG
jgi:molybdopterin converting factor small subunit